MSEYLTRVDSESIPSSTDFRQFKVRTQVKKHLH